MDALRHPVILTYHSISEGKSPLSTSPSTFAEQMQWLKTNATVITLRQLVRVMKELQPLPERAVVLTFDDGHRDFRTAVAPVLRRLQLPATIFVSTACCGAGTERLEGCASGINRPTLAWYQIRQLHQQGFGVGAHSISHLPLTEMSPAEVEREVAGNKAEFESLTGEPVEFFAYPYGRWNSAIRRVVQRYYAAACSTAAGVVHSQRRLVRTSAGRRLLSAALSNISIAFYRSIYSLPRRQAHHQEDSREAGGLLCYGGQDSRATR